MKRRSLVVFAEDPPRDSARASNEPSRAEL